MSYTPRQDSKAATDSFIGHDARLDSRLDPDDQICVHVLNLTLHEASRFITQSINLMIDISQGSWDQ